MNLIDLILSSDIEAIERPSQEVEIKRLSKIYGQKFTLLCKALTYDKYNEIQESNLKYDIATQKIDMDMNNMQIEMVLNGVFNVADGTRFFSNKDLQKKFKVYTHKDLIKKLLLGGEIGELANIITNLSGFEGNTVEQVEGLSVATTTQD